MTASPSNVPAPDAHDDDAMLQLRVSGLHCHRCEEKLAAALSAVPGVREPEIDFNSGIVSVVYDPTQAEVPRLVGVVRETGYDVTSFQKLGGG